MTLDANLRQLLSETDAGLVQVLDAMVSAKPEALASSERQLIGLMDKFCEIEISARRNPSLPLREPLLAIQRVLGESWKLTSLALRVIGSRMESRGLFLPGSSATLCVEG